MQAQLARGEGGDIFRTLYSETCVMLAYTETRHIRNPGIFKTLPELHLDPYSEPCHIYESR